MEAVFAIFFLLLLAAFFLFFAFLAAIAHGKKILAEISVREWRGVGDGFLADMCEAQWERAASYEGKLFFSVRSTTILSSLRSLPRGREEASSRTAVAVATFARNDTFLQP